jgi:hypothetical protein
MTIQELTRRLDAAIEHYRKMAYADPEAYEANRAYYQGHVQAYANVIKTLDPEIDDYGYGRALPKNV